MLSIKYYFSILGLLHCLLTLLLCKDTDSLVLQEFGVKWSKLCLSYRFASIFTSSFKDWGHGGWQKQTTTMHASAVLRHRGYFLENKMSSKNHICGNTRLLENVTFKLTVHLQQPLKFPNANEACSQLSLFRLVVTLRWHVTPHYFAKFLNVWIIFHNSRALHVFVEIYKVWQPWLARCKHWVFKHWWQSFPKVASIVPNRICPLFSSPTPLCVYEWCDCECKYLCHHWDQKTIFWMGVLLIWGLGISGFCHFVTYSKLVCELPTTFSYSCAMNIGGCYWFHGSRHFVKLVKKTSPKPLDLFWEDVPKFSALSWSWILKYMWTVTAASLYGCHYSPWLQRS